jgi:hypothetical protein
MERADLVEILNPLALAMRVEIDKPTWAAYYGLLKDVPAHMLFAAVETMAREPREFFPRANELRAAAERQRRAYLAAHPYEGCAECEDQRGYRNVLVAGQLPMVEPCPCKASWRARLEMVGAAEPIAMLAGEDAADSERLFPTLEQLPPHIRQQLTAVADRKVLR